jgi:hypothetical protein
MKTFGKKPESSARAHVVVRWWEAGKLRYLTVGTVYAAPAEVAKYLEEKLAEHWGSGVNHTPTGA